MTTNVISKENEARIEVPGKGYLCISREQEIVGFDDDGCEIFEDVVLINMVEVFPEHRGQGIARFLLRQGIEYASEHWSDLPLRLAVVPQDKETDTERLVGFYESEGFELIEAGDVVVMER